MDIKNQATAFTATSNGGLMSSLRTDFTLITKNKAITTSALWDTGATGTCISNEAATTLGLIPTGKQQIRTPSGRDIVDTYMVDIGLPNSVLIQGVRVCDSKIGEQGLGILIGMDIITMGDFAVSNYNNTTVFTFRTPSLGKTDYVRDLKISDVVGKKHGPGKRKR